MEGHAAYLEAWLGVLRRDRTAIFTAARLAGEAFEFIRARKMPVLAALPAVPCVPPVSPLESPAD